MKVEMTMMNDQFKRQIRPVKSPSLLEEAGEGQVDGHGDDPGPGEESGRQVRVLAAIADYMKGRRKRHGR